MDKVISADGTSIAFDKSGTGPALVLVDGAFCFREYGITPKLVPLLSGFFTVYSYDRRGRGESSDKEPYSTDKEIEDLRKIVEETGEIPFICGFSSGAALVLKAIEKGIRAKKIALFEPPYLVKSSNGDGPPKDAESQLADLVRQGRRDEAVKYFMTEIMGMPGIFVFLFKQFGRSSWEKNVSVAHTLSYDVAIMGNFLVPEKTIASVSVPAVVIGGEKSPPKLKKAVEEVGKSLPKGHISLLNGQSHNVSTKVLAPCLIDFFNSHD